MPGLEVCLRHAGGSDLDCRVSAERVEIGAAAFVLLAAQDVAARKHTERELFGAIGRKIGPSPTRRAITAPALYRKTGINKRSDAVIPGRENRYLLREPEQK